MIAPGWKQDKDIQETGDTKTGNSFTKNANTP
jgi:hypothetical protein